MNADLMFTTDSAELCAWHAKKTDYMLSLLGGHWSFAVGDGNAKL